MDHEERLAAQDVKGCAAGSASASASVLSSTGCIAGFDDGMMATAFEQVRKIKRILSIKSGRRRHRADQSNNSD